MNRGTAAQFLAQLLSADLVGVCLDAIADHDLRDLVLKVLQRARRIASDEERAALPRPAMARR